MRRLLLLLLATGCTPPAVDSPKQELEGSAHAVAAALPAGAIERMDHVAVTLGNGQVLLAGGKSTGVQLVLAPVFSELFNPDTDAFTTVTPFPAARSHQTAVLLPDGRVLMAGGFTAATTSPAATALVQRFDPATNLWSNMLQALAAPRGRHTSTVLPSGKVLIVGGLSGTTLVNTPNTVEVYNPAVNGSLDPVSPDTIPQYGHTATVLDDGSGRVLVIGGAISGTGTKDATTDVTLFDPVTATWAVQEPLPEKRVGHAAVMNDGLVYVIGGRRDDSTATAMSTVFVFDPYTGDRGTWLTPQVAEARHAGLAAVIGSFPVAIGGQSGAASSTVERGMGGAWTALAPLQDARAHAAGVSLLNGNYLVTGGCSGTCTGAALDTVEEVDTPPVPTILTPLGGLVRGSVHFEASVLDNGQITGVDFKASGGVLCSGVLTGTTYACDWDSTVLSFGTIDVTAQATDDGGQVGESAPVTLAVDNTPPTGVAVTNPVTGATVPKQTTIPFEASATDDSGVASVQFFAQGVSLGTDTTAPWAVTWNTGACGQKLLEVLATDLAGNSTSSSATVTVVGCSSGGGGKSIHVYQAMAPDGTDNPL